MPEMQLEQLARTITDDSLAGVIIEHLYLKESDAFADITRSLLRSESWEKAATYVARIMCIKFGTMADDWLKVATAGITVGSHDHWFSAAVILGMFEGAVKISIWDFAQDVIDTMAHCLLVAPSVNLWRIGGMVHAGKYRDRLSKAIVEISQLHGGCDRLARIQRFIYDYTGDCWKADENENDVVWYALQQINHARINALASIHGPRVKV